ncbi:MAG: undecaprenyl/decaprenyl-phosphate alpha-N-acetylglucosaminyl 1-phosphate transferase [Chloroflexi bacterium]|nr:undecaprenyl/decaprenyl-phosphate alpha-N-acetylglucosaminyl 1-phosphate transferase [Chloroflexota bacterium]
MTEFIPFILISGVASFVATPLMRQIAERIGFVANPSADRVHRKPTPMLGGLAIYIGLAVGIALGSTEQPLSEVLAVFGGMTLVMLVGLIDDRYGTPQLLRVLVEIAAALMLIWAGIQIQLFDNELIDILLTLMWVVGICNAINFMDNMDGLAAGLAAAAAFFFFILGVIEGLGLVTMLSAAMLGATVGFLYYNFNPATLFMGDTGSLLIGFVLAVLGIKLRFTGVPNSITWIIPIIILGVPIFDTTLVVISRLRRGVPVSQGGKDHTSHRLVSIEGMLPSRSVMTLYLITVALGLMALMLRDATQIQAWTILGILIVLFLLGLGWLELRFAPERLAEKVSPPGD